MPFTIRKDSGSSSPKAQKIAFDNFEVDLRSGELRKNGTRIRLQAQPFQLLVLLLENAGELATREEICRELWPGDTFVDFEHSLPAAVNKIREALGDAADDPRYIETLPKRGYRFIGKIKPEAPVVMTVAESQQTVGPEAVSAANGWSRGKWALGVAGVAVLVVAAYGVYSLLVARRATPFETFTITPLTSNAKTIAAAISPDGKYLLSVLDDRGKQGLWLRHVQTNSDVQVIAPADAAYQSLLFSPDGSFFYFRKANDLQRSSYDLFRAPVLGGAPQLIAHDLDTAISFSPDGARIAFVRANDPVAGKFQVLTANADGTDERFVSGGTIIDWPQSVSWSPDGKQLASLPPGPGGALSAIEFRDVASAKVEGLLPFQRAQLYDLAWLPSGRGLVVTYQNIPRPFAYPQIGFVSRSTAKIRTITNDTNGYQTVTLSADGKTLAAVQQKTRQTLYLLPKTGFAGAPPPPALAQREDSFLFSWAANGDLYFDGGNDILQMSPDGSSKKTVLNDPAAAVSEMDVCRHSPYVLLAWAGRGGTNKVNIWRTDADGSNPVRLSRGDYDAAPACAPDGKWAYYKDFITFQLMRVPLGGGAPEVVPRSAALNETLVGPDREAFMGPDISISKRQATRLSSRRIDPRSEPEDCAHSARCRAKPGGATLRARSAHLRRRGLHAGWQGDRISRP